MRQELDYLRPVHVVTRAHGFGSLERPTAGKDGETFEQLALGIRQQCIAPVDRGTKRLVPGWTGARSRAAASAMARGRPSSRQQISAIACALSWRTVKVDCAAAARSTKSRPA